MSEIRDDFREALARWLNDRLNEFAWDGLSAAERGAIYRLVDDCLAGPLAQILTEWSVAFAALEPFAEAAEGLPADVVDAKPIAHVSRDAKHPGTVTTLYARDLRAAFAAARPSSPTTGGAT